MPTPNFTQKSQIELTKLLYEQVKVALWAESFAAIGLVAALWGAIKQEWLILWLAFNLLICGFGRHLLIYFYHRLMPVAETSPKKMRVWLFLFGLGAFLSGISWGATGSLLMVPGDMVRETFTIFLLIGVTAVANLFYSANRKVYAVFLLPAFMPFTIWLMLQGGIYIILSLLGLVYIVLMLLVSYYYFKLLSTALYLRFENIDLVEHLTSAKNSLVNRTHEIERSLSLIRATLDSSTDGILVVNSENVIEDINQKFVEMLNISSKECKKHPLDSLFKAMMDHLENPLKFQDKVRELSLTPEEKSFDEFLFKDGRAFEVYSVPQKEGTNIVGRVWCFRDVTKHKALEDKLFRQANFDMLTGLPNRSLLLDRTTQAIAFSKAMHLKLAVVFLDLDRFKLINDTLGHTIGDKLLLEVANRLAQTIHENDTVSREGGDEFIIILNGLRDEADSVDIVSNILNAIRETFVIEGHKFNITISIGISFYPKDGGDPELLIKNADIAMYHAKELGRNNFQFFTEDMNKKVLARLVLETQLRDALKLNEFSLVYQPILNLKTGYVIGFEALLRWHHPKRVSIPPAEFVSVAEESGIIIPIGQWVLYTACKHAKQLQQRGFPYLQIAVNLSGRQFRQTNFLENVKQILLETGLDPHFLSLELTESTIMDDMEKTAAMLNEMKKMGISIVIDDFGTGYSSLNYLKQLPVDKVKIDRSFIQDIPIHADDTAITSAIIALAAKLDLIVVAEGVEKQSQFDFLKKHRCDEMQGFYFSPPLAAEDCINILHENAKQPFLPSNASVQH